MEYHKTITLKDGRACTLRNGTAEDGQRILERYMKRFIRKADWNMRSSALPTAVTVRSCIADQPTGTSEEA